MKNRGFTLIELLIVIGIIGVLSAIILPNIGDARTKAKTASVKAQLATIEKAMMRMAIDTNNWPNHQMVNCVQAGSTNEITNLNVGTAGLVLNDSGNPYVGWGGPYLSSIPVDPWGVHYFLDTDYYVTATDLPCGQNGGTTGCTAVVALGSLGPNNDGGVNDYDSDNIIRVIEKSTTCL